MVEINFENEEGLYKLYIDTFPEKNGDPVCFEEFKDNKIRYYEDSYCNYLKETVLDDEGFDVKTTEDFWTWIREELERLREGGEEWK